MIAIVDYGMGNLRSVQKGLEKVGAVCGIVDTAASIQSADKLVLPGVGGFGDAIHQLRRAGLVEPILRFIEAGRPFLGICLGYQLLFDRSSEEGEHTGLGVFAGDIVRFDFSGRPETADLKVPHMGWNQLWWDRACPLLEGLESGTYFYFVHSYYARPTDPQVDRALCDYGVRFAAMAWRDRVFATQFHPEKSQRDGLRLLANFAAL
jgi:glutamine amidotransferase